MKIKYTCAYPLQMTGNANIVMLTWAIIVGKAVLSFKKPTIKMLEINVIMNNYLCPGHRPRAQVIRCEWDFQECLS